MIESLQKKVENKQPSNLEAEQALLGSVLVNNDIIDEISNIVSNKDFSPKIKNELITKILIECGKGFYIRSTCPIISII